jgi:RNA polymerase sigma-70 factor (ECF subfamily)
MQIVRFEDREKRWCCMDEQNLIRAAQRGDLEAFNRLVIEFQEVVFNQAYWLLGDPDMAEDITQDTFIKAFHRLPSFRGDSLRAWLLRIATNACHDELRRQKRRRALPLIRTAPDGEELETEDWLVDPALAIEETVEQAELSALLRRHLEDLPEKYRSVAVLVDVLELDYEEAAQVLGVPIGTVKSRLARARMHLRSRLIGSIGVAPAKNRLEGFGLAA